MLLSLTSEFLRNIDLLCAGQDIKRRSLTHLTNEGRALEGSRRCGKDEKILGMVTVSGCHGNMAGGPMS